jgi:phosphatidylserine synthase
MSISEDPERPIPITLVCVLGFIGAPITMVLAFLSTNPQIPEWVAGYAFFAGAARFICMLGLWAMRRWAVIALTLLCAVTLSVLIIRGRGTSMPFALIWFICELTIAYMYFRRMRW